MNTATKNAPGVAATNTEGNEPTSNHHNAEREGYTVMRNPITNTEHVERHHIGRRVDVLEYPGNVVTIQAGGMEFTLEAARVLARDLLEAQRYIKDVLTPIEYLPA